METVERIPHDKLLEYIESLKKEKYIDTRNLLECLLIKSIADNKLDEVKYIVNRYINSINNDCLSDLIYKSVISNKIEYVKYILSRSNDIDQVELNMLTLAAYKHKYIEIAEYLISEGANVEIS